MEVTILFFGMLKDLASNELLTLPNEATVQDVLNHYRKNLRLQPLLPSIAISVNQKYAAPSTALEHGDEVALLPPVSGGSANAKPDPHFSIVREPILVDRILETIKAPPDGAVVLFEGVVRNNTRGRRTLYLEYESYEKMALKQMESLCAQSLAQFEIRDATIVHRLGRLEIGETSVLVVVAAAHRASAFDACRWLIDTLKKTVPIWKKEYFDDGAVWADGERFPPEIQRGEGTH